MTSATDNNPCTLRPEGEITIFTAIETKSQLMDLLEQCQEAEIDLSRVSEMDTAGLQLLALAKREFKGRGGDLHLVGHSAAVLEVLDLCNMTAYFGDPLVITSRKP